MPWVPVAIAVVDTLVFAGARSPGWWAVVAYGLAVAGAVGLRRRSAPAAFVVAVGLALVSGAGLVLLSYSAYQAGRAVTGRSGGAVVVGAAVGGLVGQLALQPANGPVEWTIASAVTTYLVFAVLPLLVGRYLAQHERLVRHLRWSRDMMADRERLDERLRIARNMHDSLGHRLSLVSVQAAALEVADLPDEHRRAVRQLAGAARGALDELYELVGTLRRAGPDGTAPGIGAVDALVAEHRAAATPVTLVSSGRPGRVDAPVGEAVYRVVEEGLTNAAKHASGQPVTVTLAWEPDSVLVRVTNPVADAGPGATSGGFGLTGLDERVRAAGGMLRHGPSDGLFTVLAMLPTVPSDLEPPRPPATRRTVTLGGVIAVSILVVVLLAMVTGVRT